MSPLDAHHLLGRPKAHTGGIIAVCEQMGDMVRFSEIEDHKILGVIGLAKFGKSSLKKILKEASLLPKVKVLREVSPLIDPVWENGVKIASKLGYSCEVEVEEEKLFQLIRIAEHNPKTLFILAINQPTRKTPDLKELSYFENVVIKIIAKTTSYEKLKGTALDLIDLFLTERVMFGAFSESRYLELLKIVDDFSEEEKENLFYTTARKWYNLIS